MVRKILWVPTRRDLQHIQLREGKKQGIVEQTHTIHHVESRTVNILFNLLYLTPWIEI